MDLINLGEEANDGNGTNLRTAGQIINDNFTELDLQKVNVDDLNLSLTGVERYATLAEVNAIDPKSTTTQYVVDSDGDNNGYYTWDGTSATVDFNRGLPATSENLVQLYKLEQSFEEYTTNEIVTETVQESDLTNKGAGGVFTGFAMPLGVYQNITSVQLELRYTSASLPFSGKLWITENDKDGAVLGEGLFTHNGNGNVLVNLDFPTPIENVNSNFLWIAYAIQNAGTQLRTSAIDIYPDLLLATTTNSDYENISPSDFNTVSEAASDIYFGTPRVLVTETLNVLVPKDYMVQNIAERIGNNTATPSINIPSQIYTAGGKEFNIFFDNVINSSSQLENYEIDIDCAVGFQMARRWYWTPNASNTQVGSYPMTFSVKSKSGQVLASKDITVICASNIGTGQKCLTVGDSTTSTGAYQTAISDENTGEVTFLGTRGTTPNLHEGRGGWKFEDYAGEGRELTRFNLTGVSVPPSINAVYTAANSSTYRVEEVNLTAGDGYIGTTKLSGATVTGTGDLTLTSGTGDSPLTFDSVEVIAGNPFYNNGTSQLDFSNYMTTQGYTMGVDDVVHFNLGINDVFSTATDETITQIIADANALITNIRAYSATLPIAFNVTIPSCIAQDAFALNYGNGQTKDGYQRNNYKLVQALINELDTQANRDNNVYLIAANVAIDRNFGFPYSPAVTTSTRATGADGATYRRHSNAVHPSQIGYNQMGDSLYAFLKFIKNN